MTRGASSMQVDSSVSLPVCDQIMSQFKAALLACRSVADLGAAIRQIDAGLDGIDFEIDQRATPADHLTHYVTIGATPAEVRL